MPARSWPAHAAIAALWGLCVTLLSGVVLGFGWPAAASLIGFSGAAAITAATRLGGRRLVRPARLRQVVVLGASLAVQNLAVCFAIEQIGLTLSAILLGAMPLFGTLFGQIWGVNRITAAGAAGLATGFTGLLLVVVFPGRSVSLAFVGGVLAALVSAIAAGFAIRYSTLRLSGRPEIAAGAHLVAGLAALPLVLLFGVHRAGSGWGYVALVGLLLVATMVAPGLEFGVPEAGDGARAGMVKTLGLAIAAVSGVVVLREPVGPGQVLGLALLVIGSALVYELLPRQSWVRAPRS